MIINDKNKQNQFRKKRDSNIELLRIIAMLMIVIYHIIVHCVIVQLTDPGALGRNNIGIFNHPIFYKRLLIIDIIMTFGMISNDIFILISGYYMANRNSSEIHLGRISKKLLLEQGFACLWLVCVPTMLYKFKFQQFVSLQTISSFNSMSWFVGYYFAIIICGKLFINKLLANFDQKKYVAFLLTILAFVSFSWTGGLVDNLASGLRTLLTGIFLYSLGGYIHRFEPFKMVKTYIAIAISVLSYGIVLISSYNVTQTSIETYLRNASQDVFIQPMPSYNLDDIVIIVLAICMFEVFRRISLKQNRVISLLGKSTFMVYLIHDNQFFYELWNLRDWVTLLANSPLFFMLNLLKWTLYTFFIGVTAFALYTFCIWLINKSRLIEIK
ncbi:acyltransferase family protein [Lactimicrobium massiliense]|uniref:acyltransferase family protein n=1 Tax=Lactimicrobium massiliense TaxID=2161814 RepID=UPI000D56079A|nr:acyltransferase family protein [Lactimicrobium massiliense]